MNITSGATTLFYNSDIINDISRFASSDKEFRDSLRFNNTRFMRLSPNDLVLLP